VSTGAGLKMVTEAVEQLEFEHSSAHTLKVKTATNMDAAVKSSSEVSDAAQAKADEIATVRRRLVEYHERALLAHSGPLPVVNTRYQPDVGEDLQSHRQTTVSRGD
jgi:hypothetical protein